MIRVVLAGTVTGLCLLSACGSSSDPTATATDTSTTTTTSSSAPTPTTPAPTVTTATSTPVAAPLCSTVWVGGHAFPHSYHGCTDSTGTLVKAAAKQCESGQVLVTYDDRFYAAEGSQVNDVGAPLKSSTDYAHALRSCG